jgi:hypothetical protein
VAFDRAKGYAPGGETELDIYSELATAYVPPGGPLGVYTVIDERRCRVLVAWASGLIPENDDWPSAGEIGSVEYIDQNLSKAPRLRPMVLGICDLADKIATSAYGAEFVAVDAAAQADVMRRCEQERPTAFSLVLELVYECYYRDPRVLRVVEQQTGFRPRMAVDGSSLPVHDDVVMDLLTEVGVRPNVTRAVD